MVKASLRFVPLLAACLLPLVSLSAKDLADYQIGDKADEDIVATTKLTVADPDGTEALKQKEAQHVPVVIRYYTNAANMVEARFRDSIHKVRGNFLKSVNKSFGHQPLSADELGSSGFESLATLFQKQNKLFPLSTNRAALWASGDSDRAYEDSLAATLRQTMAAIIRPEPLPADTKAGVWLVPFGDTNGAISAQLAERDGKNFSRSSFVALADAKKNFQSLFGTDERDVAKYLATLLTPNCTVDEAATQELRAKRVEGLSSMATFKPGDVVAHRGQVIDKKIKSALDQLKEKQVVIQLQELQAKQQAAVSQLQALAASNDAKGAQTQERIRWLAVTLAGAVVILAMAIWQLARRRQTVSLLPVPVTGGTAEQWQQRALVAEQRAEKLQAAARAGVLANLSQWLSGAMTQRLLTQRRLLLQAQSKAATEMAELTSRLEKIHAPLQDRLITYEARIVELEKELAARGEENRELLKAKIEMMRKQLEMERGRNRLEFN
jgi:membrane-associated HD superfamily phosphohydrolase